MSIDLDMAEGVRRVGRKKNSEISQCRYCGRGEKKVRLVAAAFGAGRECEDTGNCVDYSQAKLRERDE